MHNVPKYVTALTFRICNTDAKIASDFLIGCLNGTRKKALGSFVRIFAMFAIFEQTHARN